MKLRRPAVLAAGAILLALVIPELLFAQTNLTSTDIVLAEDMLRGVRDAVKKNYYDPKYHGVDLDTRYKVYEERINKATNRGATFAEIAAYLSALHDSHTIFIPPPRLAAFHYGFRMAIIGEKAYITEVRSGSDAAEKLHLGDEILGLNHYTVNRNDFPDLNYYLYALSPQTAVNFNLRDPLGRPREVSVKTRIEGKGISGGEQRLWNEISNNRDVMEHSLRQRWVEQGDLLIWKMPEFSMGDSEVDQMIDKARKHAALILDLRGNPGGRVTTLDRMVGDVMDREVTIASRVSRKPEKPDTAKSALITASLEHTAGRRISDHSRLVSMRLECLAGLKQSLQAGKNAWPSIGAGSVSGVILGPLVMRHCYFGGFGLGHQFDSCA
ncbi:MAG TPA: PDZ domain-containing protein [Candidatus Acidoferrales bacterium]|nr:PDZ domain-containing protein [Candidatus Acidoferrales bacterium]